MAFLLSTSFGRRRAHRHVRFYRSAVLFLPGKFCLSQLMWTALIHHHICISIVKPYKSVFNAFCVMVSSQRPEDISVKCKIAMLMMFLITSITLIMAIIIADATYLHHRTSGEHHLPPSGVCLAPLFVNVAIDSLEQCGLIPRRHVFVHHGCVALCLAKRPAMRVFSFNSDLCRCIKCFIHQPCRI